MEQCRLTTVEGEDMVIHVTGVIPGQEGHIIEVSLPAYAEAHLLQTHTVTVDSGQHEAPPP